LGPLPTKAAPLALAETTPDAKLLAVDKRVLEAVESYHATATDLFGLTGRGATLWEEQVGVDTETVGLVLPARL
jgi:hypothetical protein